VNSKIEASPKNFVLVIDPGHGGNDPGAVSKHCYEKNIVLSIGQKLGNYISQNLPNVKVIYTRNTDVFIPLNERAEIANKNKADLFISIHSNFTKNTSPYGVETFLMGEAKEQSNLEVAKAENAVILKEENYSSKYGGYDPNSPETFMIFSLIQNKYHTQSLNFATIVQQQFIQHAKRFDRGVKQAGFLVLWKTAMPSVLIETGFTSNSEEESYLMSSKGQDALAYSIYKAFCNYYHGNAPKHPLNPPIKDSTLPQEVASVDSSVAKQIEKSDEKTDSISDSLNQRSKATPKTHPHISFLIQISSSGKRVALTPKNFKGLRNVEELKDGKTYKYAVGRKNSYDEVQEYSKTVKRYFPDAFIIATRNKKIIPVTEALKEILD
jgi:N-acetylmuramoyl-L-alanine amidase